MYKSIIILASLFALINSNCVPDEEELFTLSKLRKYKDCEIRTSTEELEEEQMFKCCHLYYVQETNNVYREIDTCILITNTQYDNIKKFVEELESRYRFENTKIHCFGEYIKFSLLIFLFLFI